MGVDTAFERVSPLLQEVHIGDCIKYQFVEKHFWLATGNEMNFLPGILGLTLIILFFILDTPKENLLILLVSMSHLTSNVLTRNLFYYLCKTTKICQI